MSLDYVKFSPGFETFMPKEYRDMVEHGPFGKKVTVSQMGSFKEILEEHPMCAGCAMTLFIRLAIIAFPNPEDTITVGTAGCGRLAISQAAIPFVYGNYGDQNGVASGLSRGLRIRFGDKPKDVVVIADGVQRLPEADEVHRDELGALVDELVEGVLAVRARLAPDDRSGLTVDRSAREVDALSVALHVPLLKVGRERWRY